MNRRKTWIRLSSFLTRNKPVILCLFFLGFILLSAQAQVVNPPDSSGTGSEPDTNQVDPVKKDKFSSGGTIVTTSGDDSLTVTVDSTVTVKAKKERNPIRFGRKNPRHSWKTATWMSAVLPGLGQVYNGKWWKVPIVYGALAVPVYFMLDNHLKYIDYRNALRDKVNGISNPIGDLYQPSQLITMRDGFRKNRDVFILVTAAVYALNIVDALVDGHLYRFDVGEDLSMKIQPAGMYMPGINQGYVGMSITLGFKSKR